MLTRREFVIGGSALGAVAAGCRLPRRRADGLLVNDIHSQLNPTRVGRIVRPASVEDVVDLVHRARAAGEAISVAGGRHAMGGQQFGAGTVLIDTTGMNRVLRFDADQGEVEVEAGIEWPELVHGLIRMQQGRSAQWGIVQKQTGADRLTIGGALASNVHGRGLRYRPFVQDIESFVIVDAAGTARRCSRQEHPEFFALVVGGYGLFGIITSVTLRLAPRRKLERVVRVLEVDDLLPAFERRIADGFLFGDFQYTTDERSADFLRRGVFSCYRPVAPDAPMAVDHRELSVDDWRRLLHLSHADKRRAFEEYAGYYLSTSGQIYWSDESQLSVYIDDYHRALDRELGGGARATEMLVEMYVPRRDLPSFLADVRRDFRTHGVDLIYGTIRLIERDDETFLAWAREPWACIVFNLHVVHGPEDIERATADFRRLIDIAVAHGGSYFPTYHRWATRQQVEVCHPQFAAFLQHKRRYDPEERFQSEWYRHYRRMFADVL
jgi:FAD/FMN-containing dehydrogenase